MSQTYIATFFSHFDAVQFGRVAKDNGIDAKLMPVPRKISSSCGTGAQFILPDSANLAALITEGVDKIYSHDGQGYVLRHDADDE